MCNSVSIYCPFCHKYTSLTQAIADVVKINSWEKKKVDAQWTDFFKKSKWWIGICNGCNHPVLVENNGETIYPHPIPKPAPSEIPDHIRKDIEESSLCFSVGAYRASAVLARRALQAAAIEKGCDTDMSLVNQIKDLRENGKITDDLAQWATSVRLVGNDAAHPGKIIVDKEASSEILELALQFLNVVFVTPALAERAKSRRSK